MRFVFNFGYLCLALLASPLLLYRRVRHKKYQRGWSEKLRGQVPVADRRGGIWFHAVSVGEVNVLVPVIRALRRHWPDRPFLISTTSQTGFELARSRFPDDLVSFAPLDFSWAVRRALDRWQPKMLVLVELELWPNLIHEAHRRGIKTAIVNGRLSDASFAGYRRFRWLFTATFRQLNLVAVQSQLYADRFCALGVGVDRIAITGSTKFDQVKMDRNNDQSRRLRQLLDLPAGDLVFVAGSTQAPEEEYALEVFRRLRTSHPGLRMFLVPRHRERFDEVAALLRRSEFSWARRTALGASSNASHDKQQIEVLLVDSIGELADWWGLADVAFVGGSFGSRGGQNMLEPAAYGAATCFGPRTENFREISESLVEHQAAVVVSSVDDMYQFLKKALDSSRFRQEIGERARSFVRAHQGAIAKTCDELVNLDALAQSPSSITPHLQATSKQRISRPADCEA